MTLSMIPNDFDVELILEDTDISLFAAARPDVWHFVQATSKDSSTNLKNIEITQLHLPRYAIARAYSRFNTNQEPTFLKNLGIHTIDGGVCITLQESTHLLPAGLSKEISKDLGILEKSLSSVHPLDSGFEVLQANTAGGNAVVTEQFFLAEAIAFERESRGYLDPSDFALYSAFCTWRDFLRDDPDKKDSIAHGMAQEMISWDPNSFGDDPYWNSVFEIQERLWGSRRWGPGIKTEEEFLLQGFQEAFTKLSSIQFTQFVLMNGMHQGGPFHALATLNKWIDFNAYNFWRARGYQPDSAEEQEIRTQSTFIELLGLLG